MEKNTLVAILLSMVIILGWFYFIEPRINPREEETVPGREHVSDSEIPVEPSVVQPVLPVLDAPVTVLPLDDPTAVDTGDTPDLAGQSAIIEQEERIIIDTDIIRVVLSSAGGNIVSYRLKEHLDKGEAVEMILPSIDANGITRESQAFTIAFGGQGTQTIDSIFRVSRPSPLIVEFSRDFSIAGQNEPFTLTKRYEFKNDEYMFQLAVSLNSPTALNFNNAAYTLGFGPQIGPVFQRLDNRYEYRHYYALANGKRSNVRINTIHDSRFTWAGIAGKYFTALVIPDDTLYTLFFSDRPEPGIPDASRMYVTRPATSSLASTDVFHFYLGPKNQGNLGRYDTGENSFRLRNLDLIRAASSSGFLAPLETGLKWLLNFFFGLVGNYGIAIILLTLAVKIITFPLTKKSSEASFKMQTMAPKIKEIQAKYKDNPAKMNVEMQAMYKKAGTSPVAGCLPMVIQMPLLFAMFNLFNNHFELRGAMFIPVWIPDLSLPEYVLEFGTTLPLLGWDALRILPFIFVGSQLLHGLVMKTPEQQGNPSMKLMLYAMPIVFFFILYNMPSGLLVYWIFTNSFTLIQQVVLNKYLRSKKAAAEALTETEIPTVIAPRRKKKR